MTALSGKERALLRAEANRLSPTVWVGQQGLSRSLIASLDDALRTHELVKVKLGRTVDVTAKDAVKQLTGATKSEAIQVIGRTATLYRHNPELERKGDVPAWEV